MIVSSYRKAIISSGIMHEVLNERINEKVLQHFIDILLTHNVLINIQYFVTDNICHSAILIILDCHQK